MLLYQTVLETFYLIFILNVKIISVGHGSRMNLIVSLLGNSYDSNTNSLTDCILCMSFYDTSNYI